MNQVFAAEFVLNALLAMANVPKVLLSRAPTANSFGIRPRLLPVKFWARLVEAGSATPMLPPCTTKPGSSRYSGRLV